MDTYETCIAKILETWRPRGHPVGAANLTKHNNKDTLTTRCSRGEAGMDEPKGWNRRKSTAFVLLGSQLLRTHVKQVRRKQKETKQNCAYISADRLHWLEISSSTDAPVGVGLQIFRAYIFSKETGYDKKSM